MFSNNLLMGAASAGGESLVSVGNSALFDSANSEYLSRTPSSAGNRDTWTISYWVYKTYITGAKAFFTAGSNNTNVTELRDQGTGILEYRHQDGGSVTDNIITTAIFRDIGWYHIVWAVDTTQAVESNRIILYVNGERITDFSTANYPAQNADTDVNATVPTNIGARTGPDQHWSGYMAEAVLIDGLQLTPTSFGQYDSTGTFWTPLSSATIKALTFGTNGFYLDNTTNAETDASGEGNNFTNNNTVTTTTHTPTNIEFLMSPINITDPSDNPVLSNGNRTYTASSAGAQTRMGGNIPFPSSGKWLQGVSMTDTNDGKAFAVWTDRTDGDGFPNFGGFLGWHLTSGLYGYNSSGSGIITVSSFTASDQCWIAVDIDNSKVWLGFYDDSASTITWYAADGGTDGNPATGDNPFESIDCSGAVFAGAAQNSKAFTLVKEADCPFTIPTGYSFLSTTNLASAITRTHSNLEEYFDTTLYEGNGAGQRVGKFLPFTNTFTVANSALFDDGDTELTRTPSSDGNLDAWTFSTWVKFCNNDDYHSLFGAGDSSSNQMVIYRLSDGAIRFQLYAGASFVGRLITTRKFLDTSRWYNVVAVWNSGSSDSGERMRIFVDGVRITSFSTEVYPSQNLDGFVNDASYKHFIGNDTAALANASDVYLSQTVLLDGTTVANADNFGQVDTSTGRWIPKQITGLTMGTNGFFMDYAASGANLGDDAAGSIDYANDGGIQVADTPTVNANVWNPSESGFSGGTFTNGNRTVQTGTSQYSPVQAGLPISSGKWYTEVVPTATSNVVNFQIGITKGLTTATTQQLGSLANDVGYYGQAGKLIYNGESAVAYGASYAVNDVIGMAIDFDANTITFYKNGASQGAITLPDTSTASTPYFIACNHFDNASNGTFLLRSLSSDWTGTAPTGHLAIIQDNMPTGESYQTAFSWIKNRDATDNNMLFDRVRGIYNDMHSNASSNQVTNVNTLQRFLNGGVQVGNDVEVNTASESYAAWNWYMETTGSGTSNTDGTINTTATLVDTNIGLSISQFTGTGSNATIGHGLGVVPQMYWVKGIDAGDHWYVYHANNTAAPQTDALLLNGTGATFDDATLWNDTAPTSSVISLGSNTGINQSSKKYLAMAFAPSQFTSIGSYKSNANANGPFVPTINSLGIPIQPAWVMVKDTSGASQWWIWDNQRSPFNLSTKVLYPNLSNAESTSVNISIDMVEGGFKLRTSSNPNGSSGNTYIYLAFGTPIIDVDGRIITGR